MKSPARLLWWVVYTAGALVVQQHIPGVDALVPGFLLALQENRRWQTFWVFILFVLIQEGGGSLGFGSAVLWYAGVICLYQMAQRMFTENILFVCMLAISIGTYRSIITLFMCAVQEVPIDYMVIARESLLQALIIPLIWGLACLTRSKKSVQNGRQG